MAANARLNNRNRALLLAPALLTSALAWTASAQVITNPGGPASQPAEPWMESLIPNPDDPRFKAYAAQQRLRKEKEREVIRFRRQYFGKGTSTETRQIGFSLLRERYDDPALYPLLLDVFEPDSLDIKTGLLDLFTDAATDEADATLAWMAVHDDAGDVRAAAATRLTDRVHAAEGVSDRIRQVVAGGLQEDSSAPAIAAAGLAETFNLYEMVPLLIAAQVGGNTGGTQERTGNLGWIVIGQQQSFVSDLQPVVSDSAVGFDPTLSVITEGVVLEVRDAVVYTYRTEIFYSLTRMTSNALGRPTGSWGLDQDKWWAWYDEEWKPWMQARAAEAETAPAAEGEDKADG